MVHHLLQSGAENLIRNLKSGNFILYGLGYGVAFAVATYFSRIFLTVTWKARESSILDSLLQKKTTLNLNRFLRGATFFSVFVVVVGFVVAVNNPWLGMTWVWENDLSPLQTLASFGLWLFAPWMQ